MVYVQLQEQTEALLNNSLLGNENIDSKVRQLLEAEYIRRMGRYQRTDQNLRQKYSLSFEAFIEQRITEQRGNNWEVERDAMDWETAVGGIATIARKLKELHTGNHD